MEALKLKKTMKTINKIISWLNSIVCIVLLTCAVKAQAQQISVKILNDTITNRDKITFDIINKDTTALYCFIGLECDFYDENEFETYNNDIFAVNGEKRGVGEWCDPGIRRFRCLIPRSDRLLKVDNGKLRNSTTAEYEQAKLGRFRLKVECIDFGTGKVTATVYSKPFVIIKKKIQKKSNSKSLR